MNARSYRLVFSKRVGMMVPVSEVSRSLGGKRRERRGGWSRLLPLVAALLALPAWALDTTTAVPTGANVRFGNVGISQTGNTLNINQSSQNGIIHWNTFNIGSAATVNFNQPNVTAATLNRVVGNEASVIQGALNATGAVYVINRNGILFDKGSQVNLHSLVASSLDIQSDELFKNGYLTTNGAAFSDTYTQYVGTAVPAGMVQVAEGAAITASTGGQVVLLAPDVENKGIIQTDTGQVILAAGHKAYFHLTNSSDSTTLLRGMLVEVESGGSAVNLGTLVAEQGDATLVGKLVKQQGVISASSSVNLNGTIHLLAREIDPNGVDKYQPNNSAMLAANKTGQVIVGENSRTAIMPSLDADKVKLAIAAGKLTQAQVDAYRRGEANPADFYVYLPDTTIQDAQTYNPGTIKAEGRDIWVQQGALLRVPGGNITLQALQTASVDPSKIFLTNSGDPGSFALNGRCLDCRVQVDSGATLDVAGLRDVAVAMERNVVEVELRGSVVADTPLLHDTSGPLYGKIIKVDSRTSGTADVNGQSVSRQGTTLLDASGYIAQVGRKIDEKSTAGGQVNLYADGEVVVQQGSTVDLSGGSLAYQTGTVTTSRLLANNTLVDIATATADKKYSGLGPDKVVTEQGYLEGKDAGTLSVVTPLLALQGDLKGSTVIGQRQRGQTASALPKQASLKLGIANSGRPESPDYRILNEIIFSTASQSAAPDHGVALAEDLKQQLVLDAAKLKASGIGNLVIYTNNAIRVEAGQTLDLGPGGSAAFYGARLDVLGDIVAPGGNVSLTTTQTVYSYAPALAAELGVDVAALDQRLSVTGDIITAGLWSNDYLAMNSLAPVVLNGGSISLNAFGLLGLESGSLLDASGGAWLKRDGKTLAVGKGGDITLNDKRPNDVSVSKPSIHLAGELRSYGLLDSNAKASAGGKLTLSTLKLGIGGSAPDSVTDGQLWLSEGFFQQGGFSNYALTGANGVSVADGAVVRPRTLTRTLNGNHAVLASGSSLASFASPSQLLWNVAKGQRPGTSLSLTASDDIYGGLRIGLGSIIDLDPRASLTLSAVRDLVVEGDLSAPAGNITLALKDRSSGSEGYLADAGIWLGANAHLSTHGVARTYVGSSGRLQGEVLDGGSISLQADNGFIVAAPGSTLDVSGSYAYLDLPRSDGSSGYTRSLLASSGGSLRLAASEGIFLGGELAAAGGSAQATRGSLSVELDRPDVPGSSYVLAHDYLTGARSIELYADSPDFLAYLGTPGAALKAADNGRAVLSSRQLAQFDHVNLKSRDSIAFKQSLDLSLRGRLSLDTASVQVADAAAVSLDALAISLGNADPIYQANAPLATAGTGTFNAQAGVIDLIGRWSMSGVAQANLNSDGDIRLIGVVAYGDTSLSPLGQLSTAGDLNFTATQVYPTTLSAYTLESLKTGGTIAFHSNGQTSSVPLAAGGALTVKADNIDQDGVLRSPLGAIVLEAKQTLTLQDGSLTSVSAEGSLIPYGLVANGQTWTYDLNMGTVAKQITVFSGADDKVNLPSKNIQLKAASIDQQAGAKLDLSGGGDLYAYEFTPGSGGSSDYLANAGVYAIVPANGSQVAPFDFQYSQYAYSSAAGAGQTSSRSMGSGASQLTRVGETVYLSAIPALGIAAGYYTLLPGHYALLPGAVAVRAVANTQDMSSLQNTQRTDGSYLVAGYRSSLGSTDTGAVRWSGFEVASREVVTSRAGFEFQYTTAELKAQTPSGRAEIHDYLASQLIPGIAAVYDLALPKMGPDAGRLSINAQTLKLDGSIDFSHASGTYGGELDIASSKIAVTDGSAPQVANPGDYLVLNVDTLTSYGVDSLMLGGTREAIAGDAGSIKVNQVADAVVIETSAAKPLTAAEVMLVSKGSVSLADDSQVRGEGGGSGRSETLVFGDSSTGESGDGVLVRAASGDLRGVTRRNVSRSGDASYGLYTGTNALVYGARSVNLDATYSAFNLGKVELGTHGALQLGATRVALGTVNHALEGVFVTNSLLQSLGNPQALVLKSYSNFDIYGHASLGNSATQSLTLQGAGFASVESGDLSIVAKQVRFTNTDGTSLDTSAVAGSGTMTVSADHIEFATGNVETAGFEVDLIARGEIAGVVGIGGLSTSGNLNLTSQRLVGYDGSDLTFTSGGKLTTVHYTAASGETLPSLAAAPMGARMSFTAANGIDHGGSIEMPAGVLSMTAENGDLNLLAGSRIYTGGAIKTFRGVNDTVTVAVAGGSTQLQAQTGNLTVAQGASVDVSGAGGADAGRLALSVPTGTFSLQGQLIGTVEASAEVSNPWLGSLSVDALVLDDGDAATSNEFSSLLQHVSGFGENFSLRQRSGDLTIAAADTVTAKRVTLSVDDGALDVAGHVDAQADEGGWVVLAAGKELYLRNGAVIDARATGADQGGGEAWLLSGMNKEHVAQDDHNGALVLENGSQIKVGGTRAATLSYAGNTAGSADITLSQMTGGRVHLQAPRLANGKDVRITQGLGVYDDNGGLGAIGTSISGASLVEALGNKVFSYATLGTSQMTAIKTDTQTYASSAAATQSRLGGSTLGSSLHARAGVEVRSTGDLAYSNDTDFGTFTFNAEPGTLTLRAAGNLLINGSLSDGFTTVANTGTLKSGNSWSYRLVAGADLGAADPLATVAGSGDFTLKAGKLIRTGTGSIQIASGGDVKIGINSDGSDNRASVIYTAGRVDANVAAYKAPATSDAAFKKVAFGVDGGALSIVAAGSIVAPEYGQLTNNWLQRRGTVSSTGSITTSPTWGVAYEYFNQGVGALAGGTVWIEAGDNIDNLSVSLPTSGRDYAAQNAGSKLLETGGGDAQIYAGGDIRGSFLYVQKGTGRIAAGDSIGAMPATDLKPDTSENRSLILAMGNSQMQVIARDGLVVESVFNPTVAATAPLNQTKASSANIDFFTYGDSSSVSLVSVQGDVQLSNSGTRTGNTLMLTDLVSGEMVGQNAHFIYPGSVSAVALNGSLDISGPMALYPASQGQLHLLAHDDVLFEAGLAMSDVDPAHLPSLSSPSKGFDTAESLLFSIQATADYHAPTLTHLGDSDPVRIYAETGNVQYLPTFDDSGSTVIDTLHFPKPVEVLAGHDIRDLSFVAQHVAEGQSSYVWAARDVSYLPLRNSVTGNLLSNGTGMQVDGPGYLNVAAGRNVDLGSSGGIASNGNLHNPALPDEGAHITVLAGMGADANGHPRQPDYATFAATYLAAGSAAMLDFTAAIEDFEIRRVALLQNENAGLSYAQVQTRLKDPAYRATMRTLAQADIATALAAFTATPLDVQARRVFYHELEMAGIEANQGLGLVRTGSGAEQIVGYARANKALQALFPSQDADGNTLAYAGDLRVFFSQIRTNKGGDIELLVPGGEVAVGLISNPADLKAIRKDSDLGLFTVNGGSINSYSSGNFAVNTSRVFTLGTEKQPVRSSDFQRQLRDNILLYSQLGDVDAGKGAKTATAAPPPTYEYDSKGNLTVNLASSISGSGIGVLLAREVIVPGDVSLIAPNGEVNAGDAGIRASGNLNIAAARVIGADNIQVSGLSVGVPVAMSTGGLTIAGADGLGDAGNASSDVAKSMADANEAAEQSAKEMKESLSKFKPTFINVEVLDFGGSSEDNEDEKKRKERG